jgi:hypothetical protein
MRRRLETADDQAEAVLELIAVFYSAPLDG